ncbi:hypothetical protein ACFX2C_021924 [Malus domestica]
MDKDREANTRYVASSLEVLFLHPMVVSLTDEDAQVGVLQVTELGDLPNEVTDKISNQTSKQATWIGATSASGLFLNWTRGFSGFLQSIRLTQEFEGQNKSIKSRVRSILMIWDTFAVDKLVDKHKMLKMSTREQCQTSFIQGNLALEVRREVALRFSNKQSCRGSGSQDSENGASLIFEKAILLGF